jgi:hypothetical protein
LTTAADGHLKAQMAECSLLRYMTSTENSR